MPHGVQKLFGWMGGHGLEGTGQSFSAELGATHGYAAALAAGLVETLGGLALALGLATRLVAAAIATLLVVAASVHLPAGYFWTARGWAFPALWAIAAAVFAVKGGGRFSLDALATQR